MEKSVRGGEASIIFLCSIGAFFIKLPLSNDDGTDLVAALFSFLLSALSVFVIYRPLTLLLNDYEGRLKGVILPLKLAVIGALVIFAVDTLAKLTDYTENVVLRGRSRPLIFIFLATIFVLVGKVDKNALSKTAVALFLVATGALAAVFLFRSGREGSPCAHLVPPAPPGGGKGPQKPLTGCSTGASSTPFQPGPDRRETAEPFIPTAWLHTFPVGLVASPSLSFHLHEMGASFPCPPTSQRDEGPMR